TRSGQCEQGGHREMRRQPGRAEHTRAALLTFQVAKLFRPEEKITVPLLRLMAATNDARYVMTQVVRGNKGGRQPRNRAELYRIATEQFYLVRALCGHVYEAGTAFRKLWNHSDARRRIRRAMAQRAGAQERLAVLVGEFDPARPDRLEKRVLEPIRNHWAFH